MMSSSLRSRSYFPWFSRVFVAAMMLTLAACAGSSVNKSADGTAQNNAVPGSKQDFSVNVGDRIFFPTDVTSLPDTAKSTLRRQAVWLTTYPSVKIIVQGHADERGTREYNIGLSARRASNAKAFLVAQGIETSRIKTISFGKERPVAVCDDESCWSQNRRAVTVVTGAASS